MTTREKILVEIVRRTKTGRSRGSREGVFVNLAKGMKNRESSQGFELTRTARAARFPTHPEFRCSTSSHPPVSINRLPEVGGCAGKIATPVSIRWPLPHLGEIVRSVQFKTVARLRFTDRFTVDLRELSLKRIARFLLFPSFPLPPCIASVGNSIWQIFSEKYLIDCRERKLDPVLDLRSDCQIHFTGFCRTNC